MIRQAFAFSPRSNLITPFQRHMTRAHSLPILATHRFNLLPSQLVSSVNAFDASGLTDTIVVSNSFWNTLSSKLPALLLAEVLASLAFVAIVSVLIAQGKFLFDVTVASDCRRQKNSARGTNQSSIDLVKLLFCISIDVLGSSNEVIPLVGEVVDVIYAPIAALLLRQLFQGSNVIFLLEFTEEILPFTDIVPLATICWVVETFFGSSDLARV